MGVTPLQKLLLVAEIAVASWLWYLKRRQERTTARERSGLRSGPSSEPQIVGGPPDRQVASAGPASLPAGTNALTATLNREPASPPNLIPCPACRHLVSRAAPSCPNCGHPQPGAASR